MTRDYKAQPRIKMTHSMREKIIYVDGVPISGQQVAAFLSQHPEFLMDRAGLLESMIVPHLTPENPATSLIERQVNLLRKKNQYLTAKLNQLTEFTQQNHHLFDSVRQLTLSLLDEQDPYILLSHLERNLLDNFGVAHVRFFFFKKHLLASKNYGVVSQLALRKKLPAWKNIQSACYGPWSVQERLLLLPETKESLLPIAIIPLLLKHPIGFITLGYGPDCHFKENMDVSLLNYIGDMAGKWLCHLLNLEWIDDPFDDYSKLLRMKEYH